MNVTQLLITSLLSHTPPNNMIRKTKIYILFKRWSFFLFLPSPPRLPLTSSFFPYDGYGNFGDRTRRVLCYHTRINLYSVKNLQVRGQLSVTKKDQKGHPCQVRLVRLYSCVEGDTYIFLKGPSYESSRLWSTTIASKLSSIWLNVEKLCVWDLSIYVL